MKIAFIGGDERMLFAASNFAAEGADTYVFGFDINVRKYGNIKSSPSLRSALENTDILVLPLPCSKNGKTVFAPFSEDSISLSDIADTKEEKTLVICGKADKDLPFSAIDYYLREDFAVLNAVPTAEGAVKIAIEETKRNISGMSIAVLGFGRVGKILSKTLVCLGADVSVFARKADARAWAKAFFCKAYDFSRLNENICQFDCIFNTVPHKVLFPQDLALIKNGAVIIELASLPGGTEASELQKAGIRLVSAQGLPGKIAPKSAGKIIYETVKEIISEEYR